MRVAAAALVAVASSSVVAQDASIVGKYSGSVTAMNVASVTQLVLDIQSVSDGKVSGVAHRYSARGMNPCNGDYPIQGTLKDNQIDVRATDKGGKAGDCNLRVRGNIQGNKIVARWGNSDIELTK